VSKLQFLHAAHNTDKKQHEGELYDSDEEDETPSKPDAWPREEMETEEKSVGNTSTGPAATPAVNTNAQDSDIQNA